jgi:hypothetical protein
VRWAERVSTGIENARLLTELRERTSDLTESLEQQTATSFDVGAGQKRVNLRLVALEQHDFERQMRLLVKVASHAFPNRHHLRIVRDERGGFIEGQRRYQSRLGATRRRGFGHNGDTASRGRLEGWFGGRHPVAAGIARACEASLTRLGTDDLDLYLLHWPNGVTDLSGVVAAFESLRGWEDSPPSGGGKDSADITGQHHGDQAAHCWEHWPGWRLR